MRRFGRILCTALLSAAAVQAQNAPIVKTAQGRLRGTSEAAKDGGSSTVLSFKGIPFAAPPVGELRWKEPQPPQSWKGMRDATEFGASCMQPVHSGDFLPWTKEFLVENKVSENCLFLNVWTPKTIAAARLPVIVFIHGGGFVEGSGAISIYNGANLSATGAVVVTLNYRLGVFGFFAHPELTAESPHHASGNYGFMDQIAALQWVKQNIAAFGGDPSRVTIWGQSAGAFSVGALLASPAAAGLFQRAQADSGLSLGGLPMPPLKKAEQAGTAFASKAHAGTLAQLRAMPAEDLLKDAGAGMRFFPDVDGWILPDNPVALNQSGHDNDVPVVTGNQENDYLLSGGRVHTLQEYKTFVQNSYGDGSAGFLELYPANSDADVKHAMAESARDRERVGMFLWASQRTASHKSPVFTYFWTRAIPWPQHPEFGAFHTGELPYLFRNLDRLDRPWEPADKTVAQDASAYLLHFAAEGNPNGSATQMSRLPQWPAVSAEHPETMRLDVNPAPMPLANAAKLKFWTNFFGSLDGKPAPVF